VKLLKGSVVIAEAGRDGGGYFAVIDSNEKYCLIADGKSRTIADPKRKNIKHVRVTNSMIDLNDITDKKLRKLMKEFREAE
jgi:ribosomal protein L14E/L6E/L27E